MIKLERKTSAEWQELIKNYKNSRQKTKNWCIENKINLRTFMNHLSKENKKSKMEEKDQPNCQELIKWQQIIQDESETKEKEDSGINIKIGKFTIVIWSDANISQLKRICEALNSLC